MRNANKSVKKCKIPTYSYCKCQKKVVPLQRFFDRSQEARAKSQERKVENNEQRSITYYCCRAGR